MYTREQAVRFLALASLGFYPIRLPFSPAAPIATASPLNENSGPAETPYDIIGA